MQSELQFKFVFYQEMNYYVILFIFWLLIDTDYVLHVSFYFLSVSCTVSLFCTTCTIL